MTTLERIRAEIANEKGTFPKDHYVRILDKYADQEPCGDAVSRQAALKELKESAEHHANDSREEALLRRDRDIIRALPPVTPQSKTGHISIDDVMSVFDDFMCGEVDEDETNTFLEMLKDKAESEDKE